MNERNVVSRQEFLHKLETGKLCEFKKCLADSKTHLIGNRKIYRYENDALLHNELSNFERRILKENF